MSSQLKFHDNLLNLMNFAISSWNPTYFTSTYRIPPNHPSIPLAHLHFTPHYMMMNGDDAKEELWFSLLTRSQHHDDLCTQWKLQRVSFSFLSRFSSFSVMVCKKKKSLRWWCSISGFLFENFQKTATRIARVKLLWTL